MKIIDECEACLSVLKASAGGMLILLFTEKEINDSTLFNRLMDIFFHRLSFSRKTIKQK